MSPWPHPKQMDIIVSNIDLRPMPWPSFNFYLIKGHQDFFDAIGESYDLLAIKELWNYSLLGILLCTRISTKSLQLEIASSLLLVNFMQDVSKDGIISYDIEGIAECTQVRYFASLLPDIAILPTEIMLTVRHWAVHLMLPWPPPHENSTVLLIDVHAFAKLGIANMVEAKEEMKLFVAKLYVLDLSCATPSIGHFRNHGPFQLLVCKIWPQFLLWKIWSSEAEIKLLIVGHPKQYIEDTILVLVEVSLYDLGGNCSLFEAERVVLTGNKHFYGEQPEFLSDKLVKKLLQGASKISSKLKNGGDIREAFEQ
uniref:Uncharacterized protein n=1 Tax=Oryza meridionalis TaxID=40149 RepID=A0A0E0EPM9_9ORYZ